MAWRERAVDGHVGRDLAAGDEADLGEEPVVVRPGHGQVEPPALVGEREQQVLLGHRPRHQVEQRQVDDGAGEVDARGRAAARPAPRPGAASSTPSLSSRVQSRSRGRGGLAPGPVHQRLGGDAALDQQDADRDAPWPLPDRVGVGHDQVHDRVPVARGSGRRAGRRPRRRWRRPRRAARAGPTPRSPPAPAPPPGSRWCPGCGPRPSPRRPAAPSARRTPPAAASRRGRGPAS